jgi:adenylate kinase family enzyme
MAEAARRIVVLGCAGAGKTTLARRLGERSGIPVVCLDAIWLPDWGPGDVERFRALMVEAHAGDAWISDGNFALATFDIRLPRADLIVWLDRPRLHAAWRAIRRVFRRGEAHRLRDLAKALRFISGFERINRPRIEAARLEHGPDVPVVHLHNDREIAAFPLSAGLH